MTPCSSGNSNTMSVTRCCLGQPCRCRSVVRLIGGAEDTGGNRAGQFTDPLGLVAIAAGGQLLMERQAMQTFEPICQRRLAIRLPEEARVAETSRHDALRVLRDHSLIGRLRVDDGEERFLERPLLVHDREVMLVMDERRGQYLMRQFEKIALVRSRPPRRGIRRGRRPRRQERHVIAELDAAAELARLSTRATARAMRSRRSAWSRMTKCSGNLAWCIVEGAHLDRTAGAA